MRIADGFTHRLRERRLRTSQTMIESRWSVYRIDLRALELAEIQRLKYIRFPEQTDSRRRTRVLGETSYLARLIHRANLSTSPMRAAAHASHHFPPPRDRMGSVCTAVEWLNHSYTAFATRSPISPPRSALFRAPFPTIRTLFSPCPSHAIHSRPLSICNAARSATPSRASSLLQTAVQFALRKSVFSILASFALLGAFPARGSKMQKRIYAKCPIEVMYFFYNKRPLESV